MHSKNLYTYLTSMKKRRKIKNKLTPKTKYDFMRLIEKNVNEVLELEVTIEREESLNEQNEKIEQNYIMKVVNFQLQL